MKDTYPCQPIKGQGLFGRLTAEGGIFRGRWVDVSEQREGTCGAFGLRGWEALEQDFRWPGVRGFRLLCSDSLRHGAGGSRTAPTIQGLFIIASFLKSEG